MSVEKTTREEVDVLKNDEEKIEDIEGIEETDSCKQMETDVDREVLKKILQEKEEKNKEYLDRLQRTMAEFDNFRKRTTKEKASMYDRGVKETIEKILPVIDNFERALLNTDDQKEINEGFFQGFEMIYKQFKGILEEIGVKEIEAVGKPFDPNYHNAVTHVEDDQYKENEVIEEFQKGYVYQDQVIRYSMVTVAN
ncbi:MAG: nucleotide exchange factor GrpE [Epulopiscium sp.]|nr:nucleotide exchange factor GrpE [Candidatus Epulonipiscium sp.]